MRGWIGNIGTWMMERPAPSDPYWLVFPYHVEDVSPL